MSPGAGGTGDTKPPPSFEDGGFRGAGDGLLSRDLSIGVPSALQGLTIVFGMGTSVAPALKSPAINSRNDRGVVVVIV